MSVYFNLSTAAIQHKWTVAPDEQQQSKKTDSTSHNPAAGHTLWDQRVQFKDETEVREATQAVGGSQAWFAGSTTPGVRGDVGWTSCRPSQCLPSHCCPASSEVSGPRRAWQVGYRERFHSSPREAGISYHEPSETKKEQVSPGPREELRVCGSEIRGRTCLASVDRR